MLELNPTTDLDQIYEYMLDAVDGHLSLADERRLEAFLTKHPDLEAEYRSLSVVNTLMVETPAAAPPAHFVDTTYAHLPNWRARRVLLTAGFVGALFAGLMLIPVLFLFMLFREELAQMATLFMNIADSLIFGIGQLFLAGATFLIDNPAAMGSLIVMLGSIVLWSGVYQQMVQRRPAIA